MLSLLLTGALQSPPEFPILRLPESVPSPVIDGVLDDPAWDLTPPLRDLRQVVPVAGAPPTEETEVLLAYDELYLYVGLRCFDRDATGIRDTQMARDANLDPDDRVELLFDTFHDRRNAFWFQIGAAGSIGDALITRNGSRFNKRWDTLWEGSSEITDEGWFAELRIPFQSINFDPEGGAWGFNVRRHIRRKNEVVRWASPEPRIRFFSVANAGVLTGLFGMKQGLGLDVVPYVAGGGSDDDEGSHGDLDAGLDLYYRFTPSTKLSLSFNTDFSQTEVDARRVNLSRFPLFFPEKRKFFLEDSGVFEFGTSNEVIPFFSRRVGLDGDGNAVPLLANAKVTSSNESYRLGLLNSVTETTGAADSRNLFAGRFSKNILQQSDVGVIFTHGDPTSSSSSPTAGADLNLRTDSFRGDRNLNLNAYVLHADGDTSEGGALAYEGALSYPNDQVALSASYRVVEEGFRPALGFVRRTGVRDYSASAAYNPRLYTDIRRLRFQVSPRVTTTTGGRVQSKSLSTIPFGIDWEDGDSFRLRATPQEETLDQPFEISDGVVIPTGTYGFFRYGASVESSDRRPLSARLDVTTGTFYDGTRWDYAAELNWRASRHALFGVEYSLNEVELPQGDFTVDVVRSRVDLLFDTSLSWSNLIQWDSTSEELGWNSRLRYTLSPGRDFFLVLNQGWNTFGDGFVPLSTDLRFKLAYTVRI